MKHPHAAALSRSASVRQARRAAQGRWMSRRFRVFLSLLRAANLLAKARLP